MIEITDETGSTRRVNVAGERFIAGRLPELAVCLPADGVSRHHAEFVRDPGGRWWVRDLASRNGTRVNGRRTTEAALAGGERVRIGPYTLRLLTDSFHASPLTTIGGQISVSSADLGPLRSLAEMPPPPVQANHLSRLVQFGRDLSEIEDSTTRLRMLCELMTSGGFPGQWAVAVRLENEATGPAMLLPPMYRGKSTASNSPYLSGRLLTAVQQRRGPIMASNTGSRAADIEVSMAAAVQMHTAIACPIGGDEQMMDVLYTSLPSAAATTEWLAIAGLAAEQFQQSESLWTQRKLAAEHAIIQQELEQARKVQEQLVPHDVAVEGVDLAVQFHPCRWVGGDYVDVIPIGPQRVVLVLADVCGHGMQAALLAQTLHAALHVLIPAGKGLGEAAVHVNNYLCRTLKDSQFATAAFVELDVLSGRTVSLRAGHPPPIVIDPQGQWRELQCGDFFPLGVEESQSIAMADDQIPPGHLLALFSDGMFELRKPDGEELGHDGLASELAKMAQDNRSPAVVAENLIKFVDDLQGGGFAADDRSLLILKRPE